MIGKVLILTNNFHYFFLFDISSVTYFINKSIRVIPSMLFNKNFKTKDAGGLASSYN